jgi:hypothetical protein
LFALLAVFNLFALAGYRWKEARADSLPRSLVDLAAERVSFTPEERDVLVQLETDIRHERSAIFARGQQEMLPEMRRLLLADKLDLPAILARYQARLADRIEYLRFETRRLHEALTRLPIAKREKVVDFLIELRVDELQRWASAGDS